MAVIVGRCVATDCATTVVIDTGRYRVVAALSAAAADIAYQEVLGAQISITAGGGAAAVTGFGPLDNVVAADRLAIAVGVGIATTGATAITTGAAKNRVELAFGCAVVGGSLQRVRRAGIGIIARCRAVTVAGLLWIEDIIATAGRAIVVNYSRASLWAAAVCIGATGYGDPEALRCAVLCLTNELVLATRITIITANRAVTITTLGCFNNAVAT